MHGILNHRLGFGFSQVGVVALNSSDYNEGCFTLGSPYLVLHGSVTRVGQCAANCLKKVTNKLIID